MARGIVIAMGGFDLFYWYMRPLSSTPIGAVILLAFAGVLAFYGWHTLAVTHIGVELIFVVRRQVKKEYPAADAPKRPAETAFWFALDLLVFCILLAARLWWPQLGWLLVSILFLVLIVFVYNDLKYKEMRQPLRQ